jgi:hypothetical protein
MAETGWCLSCASKISNLPAHPNGFCGQCDPFEDDDENANDPD